MMRTFHFTIGPVQGFVAQSRRTRDLLASSFLLSYLAGCAMRNVLENHGEIIFPFVHDAQKQIIDPLLLAITESQRGKTVKQGPWVGSLPNRFQARIPQSYDPEGCRRAVSQAWQRIAEMIWNQVVLKVEPYGQGTAEIWKRQIDQFWEMVWVIDEQADGLDRRKYWQNFVPSKEKGDKCSLMPHLQELSGYLRSKSREQQNFFWQELQSRTGPIDLKESERLSAVGIIKRFFPLYARKAIGWELDDQAVYFPSTRYLATLPFRKQAYEKSFDLAHEYATVAAWEKGFPFTQTGSRYFDKRDNLITSLSEDAFHPERVKSIPSLTKKLHQLCETSGAEPGSYYAMLLMDGDQLGRLLQNQPQNQTNISQALATFTLQVSNIIKNFNGALIYAGGDDVLALFPHNQVLRAAVSLREAYLRAFQKTFATELPISISAAVVFAHQIASLKSVLGQAHFLLDEVAKEKHYRNSIAVGVYNQSGELVSWGAPWCVAISEKNSNILTIEELKQALPISPSFLYQLKNVYEPFATFLNKGDFQKFVLAEWERINGEMNDQVRDALSQLIALGYFKRNGEAEPTEKSAFSADIGLLVRWLRQKG